MDQFKVNDLVEWSSQAGGRYKKKTGKIVWILNEKDGPVFVANTEFPNHRRMFDGYSIPGRAKIGYLVEVIAGPKAKPRLYMPYPSLIKKASSV